MAKVEIVSEDGTKETTRVKIEGVVVEGLRGYLLQHDAKDPNPTIMLSMEVTELKFNGEAKVMRLCTMCKGSGKSPISGQSCTVCGGFGHVIIDPETSADETSS